MVSHDNPYYISLCLSDVCVSAFYSATAEPFALKFCMVFRNSTGKILSNFFGSDGCIIYELWHI